MPSSPPSSAKRRTCTSRGATRERRDFLSTLRDDPEVHANLGSELERLLDVQAYLGLSGDAALAAASRAGETDPPLEQAASR